jgi:uncharacterized protein YbjT (DUF2867 family)
MSKNSSTILVTGATGTVGSEVLKQLSSITPAIKIKAAIHSIENLKRVKENDAAARVEPVLFDYQKPETLREALRSVDKLFLLTPETPIAAELASNAVSEAKKAGIRHIVKQSVQAADSTAAATIVSTIRLHGQAEKIIEESGIPYTFLRPGEFMQNFIRWYSETIKEQGAFYLPAGDTKVGFVDVRDIAAVAVKALTDEEDDENGKHKNKAYTITGPEELSYYQVAEILSNATGRKIDYVNISEEEARRAMKDMGISDWLINGVIEVIELYRNSIPQLSSAVEEVTGKKPISFSQFAKDYAHVFR